MKRGARILKPIYRNMKRGARILKPIYSAFRSEFSSWSPLRPSDLLITATGFAAGAGAIITGYRWGKADAGRSCRKESVVIGCFAGAIGYAATVYFWPFAVPLYGIYKVAEVASRD
jgi:hypothetical protein